MAKINRDYDQVSGIFTNRRNIEELMTALHQRNLRDEDISILMSEPTRSRYFATSEGSKAAEGATAGGISGGLLGALIGGLTMVGTVLIPGIGLLVAGPLVGALTGGIIGTTAGGLIGALVGAGIPEHEAKFYEDALKQEGNVLVVAHVPQDEAREVRAIFERAGAHQIKIHH